jgi:hypothetical protein
VGSSSNEKVSALVFIGQNLIDIYVKLKENDTIKFKLVKIKINLKFYYTTWKNVYIN